MAECRQTAACTGTTRKACRDTCRAVTGCRAGGTLVRTVANVVTECRVAQGEWTATQRLEIKRGDCAPTVVMEIGATGTAPDIIGLCQLFGLYRTGSLSVLVGAFQRLGVSPDGRTVLFELSDQNRVFPGPPLEIAESGIFAVRADGSGVRRLGAASRARPFAGPVPSDLPPGFNVKDTPSFHFSLNGRFAVFSDRGPGADGFDAVQFMVLDVVTGHRTQVTAFAGVAQRDPTAVTNPIIDGRFIDDDEIAGLLVFGRPEDGLPVRFTVRRDGTDFRVIPSPTPIPGSTLVSTFQVTGGLSNVVPLVLPIPTTVPSPGNVLELFLVEGHNTLQLTAFGRSDTGLVGIRSRSGGRIVFTASADPLQTNPTNTCQFFSIDRLGGGLRQLTRFDSGASSAYGCLPSAPPGCGMPPDSPLSLDVAGGTLMFASSCDPFGQNLVGGQVFAMHPDGSGLRQVTHYRGMQTAADGTLTVELPRPIGFSGFSGL
jgi:hypothetical protein